MYKLYIDFWKLSLNLKTARINAGLTPDEAADKLHISRANFDRIERFPANVELGYIIRMCDLYNCTPNDLIYGLEGESRVTVRN